jgi:membrane-associated phospholipid phosphatase
MSIESSWVRTLNTWGENHISLIRIGSNDLVYVVVLLASLWFIGRIVKAHSIKGNWKDLVVNLIVKGVVILAIPIGIAILVSETVSAIYVRQRPFVAVPQVTLLVPHSADGGMPSHHIVFMVALTTTVFFYQRRLATLLALLTLLTGLARVVAGIHYPSDIVVGAVLGAGIIYGYRWGLVKVFGQVLSLQTALGKSAHEEGGKSFGGKK